MKKYTLYALAKFDDQGGGVDQNPVEGASVEVRIASNNALATLYATNDTGGATLTNPLTTDASGKVEFYATNNRYNITSSKAGVTIQTSSITDEIIFDIEDAKTTSAYDTTVGSVLTLSVNGNGSHGLGATDLSDITANIFDDADSVGFRFYTSASTNKPDVNATHVVTMGVNQGAQLNYTLLGSPVDANSLFINTRFNGVDSGWSEVWTEANLVKTTGATGYVDGEVVVYDNQGIYGLGNNGNYSLPTNADIDDTQTPTGFWLTSAATAGTFPSSVADNSGQMIQVKRFGSSTGTAQAAQLWWPDNQEGMFFRNYWDSGASGASWKEIWHDGNANLNEFSANGVNDIIAFGYAGSASVAVFPLPINSHAAPTGITVTSSPNLFTVNDAGGAVIASGVSPILLTASSPKLAILQVPGLSGMTAGQVLLLRAETANSKITVNF